MLQIISFKQQLPPKQFPFKLQTSGILTNENTCPSVNAVWRDETSPLDPVQVNHAHNEIKLSEETWKKVLDKTQAVQTRLPSINRNTRTHVHTPHYLTYSLPKPARPQLPSADYIYYKYTIVRTIIQF